MNYGGTGRRPAGIPVSGPGTEAGIRNRLDAAFERRCFLSMREIAPMLEMSSRTLSRHVRSGRIMSTTLGVGRLRPRIHFSREQVELFLAASVRASKDGPASDVLAGIHEDARRHARAKLAKMQRAGTT